MKKILLISLLGFFACSKQGVIERTTVLIDITDKENSIPSRHVIKQHGELLDTDHGKIFALGTITDVYHSKKEVVGISANTDFVSDELVRTNELVAYERAVDSLTWNLGYYELGKEKSEVFRSIIQALEEFNGNEGTLIVYSDLMEHSDLFSVYDYQDQVFLNDLTLLVETFESRYTIPDKLSGYIEIHHVPTLENQKAFTQMVKCYETIFDKRGVRVQINNTNGL